MLVLLAQGTSTELTGLAATPRGVSPSEALRPGDVFLSATADHLRALQASPGKRIALTFDDGPDRTWTPRIVAALRALGVPATFFVIGDRVTQYPGLVSQEARDGFEIGNHTFSHVNLDGVPSWQRDLQLSLTESAVAGASGLRPRLMRPPYSATPASVTPQEAQIYADIARQGFLVCLANLDGEDWTRPGVGQIVRNVTPPTNQGGVILLHDGGGDRSETLAAVNQLIPLLRQRGFRFVPLSEIAGLARTQVDIPATSSQHLRGQLLIDSLFVARLITALLNFVLIPVAVLALLRAILLFAFARHHAREHRWDLDDSFAPPVSIIVPAYNEATAIEASVRSLAGSDYPEFEVVVVDDGSTDGTAEIVEGLRLPNVRVIRQPNSGKSVALNTAGAAAAHELIVGVDADTAFERGALRRLVQPFRDERVGAVAGNTKVANRKKLLGRWQHIDYVMGFNLDRRFFDVAQCMPTVPGAIGAFRHEALEGAGWFSSATLAEDTDMTITLGRAGWRVVYAEYALAFTEAPSSFAGLWRQRYRWSYGTLQAVWKHRGAMRPGRGRIGTVGLPYLLLFQLVLPMLAPVIDIFTLYGLIFLNPVPVLAYWFGFNFLTLGLAVFAFRLDGESPRPLWAMPLQQFAYRQLVYLVIIQSMISAVQGVRLRWQHIERSGAPEVVS